MQYLDDARQVATEYWNELPKNTKSQMVYSFLFAGAIRLLATHDLRMGIFAGAIASLATAIHAFVTPIFAKIYTRSLRLTWELEMARTAIALTGSGYVASIFGDRSIFLHQISLMILYGLWNHIEPKRRDLDEAAWFGIMPMA